MAWMYRKTNTSTNGLTNGKEPTTACIREWREFIAIHGIDTLTHRCLLRGLRTAASHPNSGK